ncbi:unnamed protein product [Penicillium egyptiacum]|uniref:Uncharacterized protein n=1 Tax=Penicillium egyptiacum TaxID=1303716 RepID=A0A9W4P927_9EURO|nr:unnamed protein product [Penicillium egyptiacum]
MDLAPAYLAPPVGLRRKIATDDGFSRRDPRDGPYGVFISHVSEGVYLAIDTSAYAHLWNQATVFIMSLLWASNDQRAWAKEQLISINIAIDRQNETKLNQPPGTGCIEVHNLHRAGIQLDLAVRDAKFYRSTARYEDVRDFVWERIQNRNYPESWAITRRQFQRHIAKFERKPSVSNDFDTEDGAYKQSNAPAILKSTVKAKPNPRVSLADVIRTHAKMAASQTPRPARNNRERSQEIPRVPLSRSMRSLEYPESSTMKNRNIIR